MNVGLFIVFQEWTVKRLLKNCRLVLYLDQSDLIFNFVSKM